MVWRARSVDVVVIVATALCVGSAAGTVAGLFGGLSWALDLFAHFVVQFLVVAAIAGIVAGALRHRRTALTALAVVLVNLVRLYPTPAATVPANGGRPIRVLLSNVLMENDSYDALAAIIRERQPDVVALVEPDEAWLRALEPALAGWDRFTAPRDDHFGLALYSRDRIVASERIVPDVTLPGDRTLPILQVTIDHDGVPITFLLTHPPPPIPAGRAHANAVVLAEVARRARAIGDHAVVIGDLNTSPWSWRFRRLLGAGLRDSRSGHGILQASWPSDGGGAPYRIPIDHVLVGKKIGVATRRLERPIGSDHRPVWVELVPAP